MRMEVVGGGKDMMDVGAADGWRNSGEVDAGLLVRGVVVLVTGWLVRGVRVLVTGWLVRGVRVLVNVLVSGVIVEVSGWLVKEVREWLRLLEFRVVCRACERDV